MSALDLVGDVAYEAAAPTFFTPDPEPVLPGFERVAIVCDHEVEQVLTTDFAYELAMRGDA